jgi:hypothetical protein
MPHRYAEILLLAVLVLPGPAQTRQIGYKTAPDADQKKTLLLKDFKPVSMLYLPVHHVGRQTAARH